MDGSGYVEYEEGKCPFSGKKLTENKIRNIKILIFNAKAYEKINSKNNILEELGLKQPNWIKKSEVKKFNKQLKEHILKETKLMMR